MDSVVPPVDTTGDATPIVAMTDISITFPGVKALSGVNFRMFPGEVHSLLGENGAGKSTLIKALTGMYAIDSGQIVFDGEPLVITGPAEAQRVGISTVYQEVNLLPNLSVAENILLGREPRRFGGIDWQAMRVRASEILSRLHLTIDPGSQLGTHSLAVQQLVAIARAIDVRAKVLILDEPTSSLDADEVAELFRVIRDLKNDGVAILFVSHFLDQVYEIADRLTVLRNGSLVGEYRTDEILRIELVHKMIGKEIAVLDDLDTKTRAAVAENSETPQYLEATGLGRKGAIEPVDFRIAEGEVVGFAGLLGSGRTELARLLAGADPADSGRIEVRGTPTRLPTPRHALEHHIAFSSEDRRAEGIVGDLTVAENIVLGIQARRGWMRPIGRTERDAIVTEYMEALGVRPADPNALIRNLSGGNQQKVLLARWLATAPELLILDEPTRGIDVGAKADIQRKVAELADRGLAVIFISSELEEVLRIAQRVAVLRDRRKIGELASHDIGVDELVDFIAQGSAEGSPEKARA